MIVVIVIVESTNTTICKLAAYSVDQCYNVGAVCQGSNAFFEFVKGASSS